MRRLVERIGDWTIESVTHTGELAILSVRVLVWMFRPPYRVRLFLEAMESFGVGSLFIVCFTGVFTGLVLSYQSILAFGLFNAETMVGGTVATALVRELAPVLTGLMVTGRTGSSITTEIGNMRVTEQIDAMSVMAVEPIQYLVVPRVLAAVLMMPLLTAIFNVFGLTASYMISVWGQSIDPGLFLSKVSIFVKSTDVLWSCLKGSAFGYAIATIACYKGFSASGGARGVGEATTSSVVTGSISVLMIDYIMTMLIW